MGVWDAATPAGSDPISEGDDRIRELKTALAEALSHEGSTFPGATPLSTPIFIPGMQRDTTANRPTGDSLVTARFYANTTLNVIERYNGSTWDAVATLLPSGTKMLFYQASPPTGWTAVAVNDKFLRVVTSGGTGGTTGGSGLVPSGTITLAHTHTVNSHTHTGPSHTHSTPNHSHPFLTDLAGDLAAGTANINAANAGGGAISQGGGAGSTHSTLLASTTTSGSGTTGAAGTGVTGGTAPGTNSQLSNTAFQYADVSVGTKD